MKAWFLAVAGLFIVSATRAEMSVRVPNTKPQGNYHFNSNSNWYANPIPNYQCNPEIYYLENSQACKTACREDHHIKALESRSSVHIKDYEKCLKSCADRIRYDCSVSGWTEVPTQEAYDKLEKRLNAADLRMNLKVQEEARKILKAETIVQQTRNLLLQDLNDLRAEIKKLREEFEQYKVNAAVKSTPRPKP